MFHKHAFDIILILTFLIYCLCIYIIIDNNTLLFGYVIFFAKIKVQTLYEGPRYTVTQVHCGLCAKLLT